MCSFFALHLKLQELCFIFYIPLNVSLFFLRMMSKCIFWRQIIILSVIIIILYTRTVYHRYRIHTPFEWNFFSTYRVPYLCMFIGFVGILWVNFIQEYGYVNLSFLWTFVEFEQPYENHCTYIYTHIWRSLAFPYIILYLFRKFFYLRPRPCNIGNYLFSASVCYNYYNGSRRSARKQLQNAWLTRTWLNNTYAARKQKLKSFTTPIR
jgi:hypothetical protein